MEREKYERDVMINLIWAHSFFSSGALKSLRYTVETTWSREMTLHDVEYTEKRE